MPESVRSRVLQMTVTKDHYIDLKNGEFDSTSRLTYGTSSAVLRRMIIAIPW